MKKFFSKYGDKIIVLGALLYFLGKEIFLLTHAVNFAPDAGYHLTQISHFFQMPGLILDLPSNYPGYAYFLTAINGGFLYHLLLGKLLFIVPEDLEVLRLINVFFGMGTMIVFYFLAQEILKNKWMVAFAVVVMTNLLMYTYLFSVVNYDNLGNLLGVSAFYFLFRYLRKSEWVYFLWSVLFMNLTLWTKFSFAPIIFMIVCVFLVNEWRERKTFKFRFQKVFSTRSHRFCVFLLASVAILFSTFFWGKNIIQHGQVQPGCAELFSHSECMQHNPIYRRSMTLDDSALERSANLLDRVGFFSKWSQLMVKRTFGMFLNSSANMANSSFQLATIKIILLLATLFGIRFYDFKNKKINAAIFFALGYAMFVLLYVNYSSYIEKRGIINTVQEGRYLFLVLPLFVIVFTHFLLRFWKNKKIKIAIGVVVALFFVWCEFPNYLTNCNRQFFEPELKAQPFFQNCEIFTLEPDEQPF